MDIVTWLRLQWDRASAWVLIAAGGLLLLFGWLGVSRTPYLAEQVPYVVSAGLGGLFVTGVGAVLWLSADLRDEWRKLDRIEQALTQLPSVVGRAEEAEEPAASGNGALPVGAVRGRDGSTSAEPTPAEQRLAPR